MNKQDIKDRAEKAFTLSCFKAWLVNMRDNHPHKQFICGNMFGCPLAEYFMEQLGIQVAVDNFGIFFARTNGETFAIEATNAIAKFPDKFTKFTWEFDMLADTNEAISIDTVIALVERMGV